MGEKMLIETELDILNLLSFQIYSVNIGYYRNRIKSINLCSLFDSIVDFMIEIFILNPKFEYYTDVCILSSSLVISYLFKYDSEVEFSTLINFVKYDIGTR